MTKERRELLERMGFAVRRLTKEERDAIAAALAEVDRLTSFHDDEKTWRIGAEQERDDAMQRVKALEDDAETIGTALGAVCVLATLRVNERYAGGIVSLVTEHAAVAAMVSVIAQRDAVAIAAKEYLMRSVPDPNVGADAEDTLRGILTILGAQERDEP